MNLRIAFATLGLPFNGHTLKTKGLGGSETALIQMSQALADRGHHVDVFNNCDSPGRYGNVSYYNHHDIERHFMTTTYDVFIVSRWADFLRIKGNTNLRVLWCHDTCGDKHQLMGSLYSSDLVMLLSDFHAENYRASVPDIDKFIWKTRNGVDRKVVDSFTLPEKNPKKLIYTSRPERGLHYLLSDIFPRILKADPEVTLGYANYSIESLTIQENVRQIIAVSVELAKKYPGRVFNLGHLTKEQLYQQIASSRAMVYPTDFPEISCITAIEAQALGTPIVTTNAFALKETIGDGGILIDGLPTDPQYVERFVEATLALLSHDEEAYERKSQAGMLDMEKRGYFWDTIAQEWEEKFTSMLQDRWRNRSDAILDNLLRHSDVATVNALVGSKEEPNIPNPLEMNDQDVTQGFEEAMMRFQGVIDLYVLDNHKVPETILDMCPGYVSFGIYAAQRLPKSHIAVIEPLAQCRHGLQAIVNKLGLQNISIIAESKDTYFDLVFSDKHLVQAEDPTLILADLEKRARDGGKIVTTAEFGPVCALRKHTSSAINRYYNFTFEDTHRIFKDMKNFRALAVEERVNALKEVGGHWVIGYDKSDKKVDRNLILNIEKKKFVRPYESIAVCMIASRNEDDIGKALKSVSALADSIYVVENAPEGQKDRTTDIALKFGATVKHVKFDNFSQVRNESIKDATENWILWIDCDECLHGVGQVRKYLQGAIYNAFAIRQVHLTLDSFSGSCDIPGRLFRNKPNYKFYGLIHEHAEDIEQGPDCPILPRLLLEDVKIAHYGYLDENVRRSKCSSRNMSLLVREAKELPERKLTHCLVIRDLLNILKWGADPNQPVIDGSPGHRHLEEVVSLYHQHFSKRSDKYHDITYPMYQEALAVMGRSGLKYKDRKIYPFEVALTLVAGIGGLQNEYNKPTMRWFVDEKEFQQALSERVGSMLSKLGVGEFQDTFANVDPIYASPGDAQELLSKGINVF